MLSLGSAFGTHAHSTLLTCARRLRLRCSFFRFCFDSFLSFFVSPFSRCCDSVLILLLVLASTERVCRACVDGFVRSPVLYCMTSFFFFVHLVCCLLLLAFFFLSTPSSCLPLCACLALSRDDDAFSLSLTSLVTLSAVVLVGARLRLNDWLSANARRRFLALLFFSFWLRLCRDHVEGARRARCAMPARQGEATMNADTFLCSRSTSARFALRVRSPLHVQCHAVYPGFSPPLRVPSLQTGRAVFPFPVFCGCASVPRFWL